MNITLISGIFDVFLFVLLYTPYKGFNLANQMSRKLGVFGRKSEGSYSPCIVILIDIRENETVMLE